MIELAENILYVAIIMWGFAIGMMCYGLGQTIQFQKQNGKRKANTITHEGIKYVKLKYYKFVRENNGLLFWSTILWGLGTLVALIAIAVESAHQLDTLEALLMENGIPLPEEP